MKIMAERIKEARINKNLTQVQLAEKLFLDKSTIAKYETDTIEPSNPILAKLAKELDVSADYLLGLKDF